ncbi:MAG: acyl-CoA dehydratase activase-related protein [Oscillospiraceae bacterium]
MLEVWDIPKGETRRAVHAAWAEQRRAKEDVRAKGRGPSSGWRSTAAVASSCRSPYHMDPEIHHGIPELIASYGLAVLTEDSIPVDFTPERPLRANDQWVYHSRLYTAAEFVRTRKDLELIQLNSFGCGLDAVTTDQVAEILEAIGKLYTVLKIDEVSNLGAARIRIRSLLAAMNMRARQGMVPHPQPAAYRRTVYTRQMQREGWTILAPQMSPIHFSLLQPVFQRHGYHVEILDNDNRAAIDMGLKFVNNDACFPSITVVGQIMSAHLLGKYDTIVWVVLRPRRAGHKPGQQLWIHPSGFWRRRGFPTFPSSLSMPTVWRKIPASSLQSP